MKRFLTLFIIFLTCIFGVYIVYAGSPSGADWFQLTVSPSTGGDNTGDGGTGNPADYNYYYVGQSITSSIQINSGNTDSANIWIDYDQTLATASNLTTGTYFSNWASQSIAAGRVSSTGYSTSSPSSGLGNFGTVDFTFLKPTAATYGTGTPGILDINIGTIGQSTQSNITYVGVDVLDDAEDFYFHVWADTVRPYVLDPSPVNAATNVSIDVTYGFTLCDSKDGQSGDSGTCGNSGEGSGLNTATPPGAITFDNGSGAVSYAAYDSYACTGTWGVNDCDVSINPPSPLSIGSDTRNWDYNKTYTVNISGYQDLASSNQGQLGDPNGPNSIISKVYTFTTEGDTVSPQVVSETPTRGTSGNSVSTNIIVDIHDRKTYPSGPSGFGVDASTCRINVSSSSFTLTTYKQGDAAVTVSAVDYGYRFDINPATDFAQNETVAVSVYNCNDTATPANTMTTDTYNFSTSDSGRPYVNQLAPANNTIADADTNITFHLKDDGGGVSLADTVVYVNGEYYTDGGGAGTVTSTGTLINFASSLDFNGGNYPGDTTAVTGTASDYYFVINPQNNFTIGESVPVIVYSEDTSGNLMEQYVYAVTINPGNSACSGNAFCGSNTSWNGSMCVGTGGGGGGGSTASCYPILSPSETFEIYSVTTSQVHSESVLVQFFTSQEADVWVAYGDVKATDFGESPTYGYKYATPAQTDESLLHTVLVQGLQPGVLYFFRPIAKRQGSQIQRGPEVSMAPLFESRIVVEERIIEKTSQPSGTCEATETKNIIINTCEGEEKIVYSEPSQTLGSGYLLSINNQRIDPKSGQKPQLQLPLDSFTAVGISDPNTDVLVSLHDSNNEVRTYESRANENGRWELVITDTFDTGLHALTFKNKKTGAEGFNLFFVKDDNTKETVLQAFEPTQKAKILTPTTAAVFSLVLAAMLATALVFKVHLGMAMLIGLSSGLLVFGLYSTIINQPTLTKDETIAQPAIIDIRGTAVTPFDGEPLEGLEISYNGTAIRTTESGKFALNAVKTAEKVLVAHPRIIKPLAFAPATDLQIVFDEDMINALVRILEADSRRNIDTLYSFASSKLRQYESTLDFARSYSPEFSPAELLQNPIYIHSTDLVTNKIVAEYDILLEKAVRVVIEHNKKQFTYYLVRENSEWKFIREK